MRSMWGQGMLNLSHQVCAEGSESWTSIAGLVPILESSGTTGAALPATGAVAEDAELSDSRRSWYVILAIFFGMLGVHNFHASRFAAGNGNAKLLWCLIWSLTLVVESFRSLFKSFVGHFAHSKQKFGSRIMLLAIAAGMTPLFRIPTFSTVS